MNDEEIEQVSEYAPTVEVAEIEFQQLEDAAPEVIFTFEPWQLAGEAWGLQPEDVPQWWDGQTEVPEGYVWPGQPAEAEIDVEAFVASLPVFSAAEVGADL